MLRDHLFEKYLELYDKHEKWTSGKAKLAHFRVTNKKEARAELALMIHRHMMEISEELILLDEQICKPTSPDDMFIRNSEIY